jgi:hypothetical protein
MEVVAMFQTVEWKSKIRQVDGNRVVVLPKDLILEGEAIRIVRDKWGEISIHPNSPEGIEALKVFGPFADWTDDEVL